MNLMQNLMERIRPIVGLKSWDYCVLWKLSDDQSFLEWMGCCCAGAENINNNGEELPFPGSSALPCRDVILQHPRTKSCDLLAQLPASMPLESGIHAQTFMSNHTRWLNFSHNSDSNISEETIGTRVLIPVPVGLIELFVAKQVPEDQQVIDCVTAQCNITLEQQAMINSGTMDSSYSINMNVIHEKPFPAEGNYQKDPQNILQPPVSPATAKEKPDMPYDISADQIRSCNSPMNFLQQFTYTAENGNKNSMFFNEAHELNPLKTSMENGFQEMDVALQNQMLSNVGNMHMHMMEPFADKEEQGYEDCYKHDNGRSNSNSDSDINDDEDDAKCRKRTGKGPQSKNLMAERKRRKKLNDRLYNLRALVPKITKLDRASILGDAIEYVKELQKQVKDLQNELEEQSDDEGARSTATNSNQNNVQPQILHQCGNNRGPKTEHEKVSNGCHKGPTGYGMSDLSEQNHVSENSSHKVQQMEPQVEVSQLDGNEFFIKVFCEHKPGGFVRLMEALNSLGLEVTNVNATRHTCLVSNIFKVEIRDSEMVQADLVRDSLLELTRNSYRGWPEMAKPSLNGNGMDHHQHQIYQNHHSRIHSS